MNPASNLPAPRDAEPHDEYEDVDAVPVVGTVRDVEPVAVAPIAVQAAAVAATSFLAGAAAIVLVKSGRRGRHHRIKLRGRRRRGQKVVSSHSFLVDVHVLGR